MEIRMEGLRLRFMEEEDAADDANADEGIDRAGIIDIMTATHKNDSNIENDDVTVKDARKKLDELL